METFKLKVSFGDAQIELEGNENMVHTIFQELRDNGLGALQSVVKADKSTLNNNKQPVENTSSGTALTPDDLESSSTDELPTLETIVLKGGPKTESEWVLIYGFYCSNSGDFLFSREDLRSKYEETNRFTKARGKNFAASIKSLVSNGYISAINNNDFRIEPAGLSKAKEILKGASPSKGDRPKGASPSKGDRPKGKATQSKKAPAIYKLLKLSLSENDCQAFKTFWNNHNHTAHMDKAVLAAYWLKKEKGIDVFSPDHLFTMLRTIDENTSFDLASAIRNARNKKSYFIAGSESNVYSIHHIGEDHIKTLERKGEQT